MTKGALLFVFLFISFLNVKADHNPIVGILPFTYTDESYKQNSEELSELVTSIFSKNKRISVLDRDKSALIFKELDLQKDFAFTDGITVKQNKAYGAEVLVMGNVTKIDAEKNSVGSGFTSKLTKKIGIEGPSTSGYRTRLIFALKAFDVETGKLIESETFNTTATSNIDIGDSDKERDPTKNAVQANSKHIEEDVQKWVNKLFPPNISIATIDEKDNNGNPRLVSIVSDEPLNVQRGNTITVYEIEEIKINGKIKKRETRTAALSVREIQGDFVQCQVNSGSEGLEEKIKKSKLRLVIGERN